MIPKSLPDKISLKQNVLNKNFLFIAISFSRLDAFFFSSTVTTKNALLLPSHIVILKPFVPRIAQVFAPPPSPTRLLPRLMRIKIITSIYPLPFTPHL
ncbi:hypothetical protein Glove_498g17 [Diversispora epigaea]|uniref:Uncharacterized protein n=1 Tax=Diversispora epigaea TaxID=1348612 RepID=A0A397GLS1_9GLOM|nr:hypothetical protein Glove_498g17 [Diversispora epigaea]